MMSQQPPQTHPASDLTQWQHAPSSSHSAGLSTAALLSGLVIVGLGALAWYYLEPDLRRYMKIKSM
jgi:hypothetical protein